MHQSSWKDINPVVTYANVLECEPGFNWGPRIIHEHQFIYVVRGKGNAKIQNRSYDAKEGDLFYYGPHIVHTFTADAKEPFKVYGMHFTLLGKLPEPGEVIPLTQNVSEDYSAGQQNLLIIGREGSGRFEVPEYRHSNPPAIAELFLQIAQQYNKADETSPLMIRALFIQFLLAIKMNSDSIKTMIQNPNRFVLYVKSQLDLHLEKPYCRSWLQEWTQYNEDYVARNFRAHYGLSPHIYHHDLKIGKAKELLAFTDLPITEIASVLHFGTVHYFSRRFKMKTGHSPSDYRRLRRMI